MEIVHSYKNMAFTLGIHESRNIKPKTPELVALQRFQAFPAFSTAAVMSIIRIVYDTREVKTGVIKNIRQGKIQYIFCSCADWAIILDSSQKIHYNE